MGGYFIGYEQLDHVNQNIKLKALEKALGTFFANIIAVYEANEDVCVGALVHIIQEELHSKRIKLEREKEKRD